MLPIATDVAEPLSGLSTGQAVYSPKGHYILQLWTWAGELLRYEGYFLGMASAV